MSKSIKIQIIDLKINNIFSLYNSLKKIGYKNIEIINTKKNINSNLLFLPGVGSFYKASRLLKKNNFDEKIKNFTKDKNISVKFIEFMPFKDNQWDAEKCVGEEEILSIARKSHSIKKFILNHSISIIYNRYLRLIGIMFIKLVNNINILVENN